MMKNILSIFAIIALLFTACEPTTDEPQAENQQIKLTSDATIKVGSGNAMAFITYEILEVVEGAEVKAEADVEWISNFKYNQQGKITFTTEANPDDEPREGVITVSYDKSKFEVKVEQALSEAPTNKVVEVSNLQIKYYGIQGGMFNYYLAFSDEGWTSDHYYNVPNAKFYFVDLFLLESPEDMNNIIIPNGTYEYDPTNSGMANTFTESYSWYQINDEYGNASSANQISYEKGKLIVEDGKVTLQVTMQINHVQEHHEVVFEGDYTAIDCSNEGM